MSIDITLPGPRVIGPGIPVNLRSDFIGPLPQGAEWAIIVLTGPTQELHYIEMRIPAITVQTATYFLSDTFQSLTATSTAQPAAQETVRVTAELRTDTGVIDTGTTTAPWDPTLGLGIQAALTGRASGGGFTATDRAQLQLAVDNTTVNFLDRTIPSDITAVPVGRLPGVPPILWGTRVGPFTLTGRNVLNLPSAGVNGIWIGLRWFYEAIPPGWGMRPGAIDEFDQRPAQLVPICVLGDGEEIGQPILDTNSSGGFVPIDTMGFSGKIAYDVAPGFTVTLFMYRFLPS